MDDAHCQLNELSRANGLRLLRERNFKRLVRSLTLLRPTAGGRLLDVGSAHGWFLDIASSHFSVLGIEPDRRIYDVANGQGKPVRFGFFPSALGEKEIFDVIVFNDVIEHIIDVESALRACSRHLSPGGLLLLNLPSSSGVIYRFSKACCRVGINSLFERMWQKGLPSPHVHYFNARNLSRLANKFYFKKITSGTLSTFSLRGLYSRVSQAGSHGLLARLVVCFFASLSLPLLRFAPADIIYVIYRKE
ncbi:class I SAM-dependent methyltransferase [Pseudomonas pohangensis]|uniref:class I SAM-dependent methyltransferase n=1 Tax=Pseudomonas pohangensis TaxID=364197 RepID=UPI0012FE3AEF|nr:class I SAM-dependent methyltransferase [Pseudomonas pohangensis]